MGNFRCLGALEAIQEDDIIWLKNDEIVLSADMKGQKVYLLPSLSTLESETLEEMNEITLPDEAPTMVAWEKVSSLPEGIKVFIGGPLFLEEGRGIFRSGAGGSLLVVFYDGEADSILRRAIWNGRHRNEYWNPFTPGAVAGGTLSSIILAYIFLRNPVYRIPAVMAVGISLVPLIPLFPPGMLFFIFYRRLWSQARFLRAERDLVRLPLRHFPGGDVSSRIVLSNGELYGCKVFSDPDLGILKGRGKLRTTSLARRHSSESGCYHWFGVISETDPYPGKSRDPLIETIVTPDHPDVLARECEKRARLLEIGSVTLFCLGFGINFLLTLRGLAWLIR